MKNNKIQRLLEKQTVKVNAIGLKSYLSFLSGAITISLSVIADDIFQAHDSVVKTIACIAGSLLIGKLLFNLSQKVGE